jgi:hypothetical protein
MIYKNPREKQLALLQKTFPQFVPFLIVTLKFLGFSATEIQKDIASFLEFGPKDLMVQAQRGQAKSTITAIFAVWCLIHNPKHRILIVSAGGKQANEISTLICRIILNFDILDCLRPDPTKGDRVSVEAFDVHYSLKGIDKSPSVACTGITGNLQGKRADLLIADDVESQKNSRTAMARELLLSWIRDFASICQNGRIIYLGTPQSDSSVYNTLPQSGFTVRIWPGRYPTPDQTEHYGDMLAPSIKSALERDYTLGAGGGADGTQGQPVDPELLGEESLQLKERKQGTAFFQLQHMLCTKLADEMRYPLKPIQLVVMRLGDKLPVSFTRGMSVEHTKQYQVGSVRFSCSTPQYVSADVAPPTGRVMRIDPAGGGKNGDESGYAVVDQLNGNVYIRKVGAVPGGLEEDKLRALALAAKRWNPDLIIIEKNMGHGAFTHILLPFLRAEGVECAVHDVFETGQKELRIIDTLEPIMGAGNLVIDEDVLLDDWPSTSHHPADKRQLFTLMFQFTKVTRDRGALVKDDRLDALAGAVSHWVGALSQDSKLKEQALRDAEIARWAADPLLHRRYDMPAGMRVSATPTTIRKRI